MLFRSSGYVAAITSLSNGGQAAVLWQGGKTQTIVATGMSVNSRVISQLVSVSVNTKGDVAVLASVEAEWCGQLLLLYTAASKYTAKVLDDVNGCPYYIPSAQSLDATDGIVYYNFSRNALLYRKLDGTIQTVLAVGDKPTGAGAVSSVANWNFTPYDNLVIEASISGSPLTWLAWDHKKIGRAHV